MTSISNGSNRRHFLKVVSAGAATALRGQALRSAQNSPKPNIVLVMADDLGYECLTCYGSTSYQTPDLDRLAASGILFRHAYSQPLCTPSRVQLMTGKYNFRNYTGFGILSPKETTFGHIFQKAGYATCVVGKWQLWGFSNARGKRGKGVYPDQAGFHEYCLWQIEEREERYADPYLYLNRRSPRVFSGQYGPDLCCDYLCDFMTRKRDVPFFIYYPMILTHSPFLPTPDSPEWKEGRRKLQDRRFFSDMVSYADKIVGRIVAQLDRLGLRQTTLLIFLGDNGTDRGISSRLGDRTIQGAKGLPTDGGTRVPLIANWPGVIPGNQESLDLVDTTDFLPTMAEAAGISLSPYEPLDGRSFFPQLCGQVGSPREWVFCHYDPEWGSFMKTRFTRDQRWKLYEDGRLFDISADVLEENPIEPGEGIPEARKAREKLQRVLNQLR